MEVSEIEREKYTHTLVNDSGKAKMNVSWGIKFF